LLFRTGEDKALPSIDIIRAKRDQAGSIGHFRFAAKRMIKGTATLTSFALEPFA